MEDQGALLPLFVAPEQLEPYISKELIDGPLSPIDYIDGDRIVRGYDAAILPAVCNIWLRAREEGQLQSQQLNKAQKATANFKVSHYPAKASLDGRRKRG